MIRALPVIVVSLLRSGLFWGRTKHKGKLFPLGRTTDAAGSRKCTLREAASVVCADDVTDASPMCVRVRNEGVWHATMNAGTGKDQLSSAKLLETTRALAAA